MREESCEIEDIEESDEVFDMTKGGDRKFPVGVFSPRDTERLRDLEFLTDFRLFFFTLL